MHESSNQRMADIALKADQEGTSVPRHLASLPEETHIITGKLEANGAHALASAKATLSAKVVKLERTESGGVEYQLAIFVSEPTPVVETPKTIRPANVEEALKYFMDKGMSETMALKQVERFGVDRVIAQRNKELDEELKALTSEPSALDLGAAARRLPPTGGEAKS